MSMMMKTAKIRSRNLNKSNNLLRNKLLIKSNRCKIRNNRLISKINLLIQNSSSPDKIPNNLNNSLDKRYRKSQKTNIKRSNLVVQSSK